MNGNIVWYWFLLGCLVRLVFGILFEASITKWLFLSGWFFASISWLLDNWEVGKKENNDFSLDQKFFFLQTMLVYIYLLIDMWNESEWYEIKCLLNYQKCAWVIAIGIYRDITHDISHGH